MATASFLQKPSRDVLRDVREQISDQARKLLEVQKMRDVNDKRKRILELIDQNHKHPLRLMYKTYTELKATLWIDNPLSLLWPNPRTGSYFSFVPMRAWTTDDALEWLVSNLNNLSRLSWMTAGIIYATSEELRSNPSKITTHSPILALLVAPLVLACLVKSALLRQDAAFDQALHPLNAELMKLQAELQKTVAIEDSIRYGLPPNVEKLPFGSKSDSIVGSTEKYYAGQRAQLSLTSSQQIRKDSTSSKQERLAALTSSGIPPANRHILWPQVV